MNLLQGRFISCLGFFPPCEVHGGLRLVAKNCVILDLPAPFGHRRSAVGLLQRHPHQGDAGNRGAAAVAHMAGDAGVGIKQGTQARILMGGQGDMTPLKEGIANVMAGDFIRSQVRCRLLKRC